MIIFLLLGFVSSIFQLTLLREFTFSIAKNELSLVVAIGAWVLACALASLDRAKRPLVSDAAWPVLLSLAFCSCFIFAHLVKSFFGIPYYEGLALTCVLACAIVVLGPVGGLTGYAFAQLSDNYFKSPQTPKRPAGHLFAFEALGVFAGGTFFTFVLSRANDPLSFCALPLLLIPVLSIERKQRLAAAVLLMFLSVVCASKYPAILEKEFQGAKILYAESSFYGPVILAEKNSTRSLYLNGALAATSEDKEAEEAFVHTVFASTKKIDHVLWIGPCFSSQTDEVQKYPFGTMTCVDVGARPFALPSFYSSAEKTVFITQDPRYFLKKDKHRYDLIVMNMAAPSSLARNRFFTSEFFRTIQGRLTPEGVFAFAIPSKRDILSPSIQKFNSSILNALRKIFAFSFVVPGDNMLVLNSGKEITAPALEENFENANIQTRFFTRFHLKDALDPGKKEYVERMIDPKVPASTDLTPYGFLYYLLIEQAKFYPRFTPDVRKLGTGLLVLSFFVIALMGFFVPKKKNVFALLNAGIIGFLSISFSALIYFAFQLSSGALFWKLGIILGTFMLGLSAGSLILSDAVKKFEVTARHLAWSFALWLVFALETWFWATRPGHSFWMELIWYVSAFECGALTGLGYPLLIRFWQGGDTADEGKTIARIYAADLWGTFAGTMLFSVLLVPLLGIKISFLVLLAVIIVLGLRNFL